MEIVDYHHGPDNLSHRDILSFKSFVQMRNDLEKIKTIPSIKKELKARNQGYDSLYENYDTHADDD